MGIQTTQGFFVTSSLAMNAMDSGAIVGVKGYILGAIYRIRNNQKIVLGRDPYQCDLLIKGSKVSRCHCVITYLPGVNRYQVRDCSMNGCFLGTGVRLRKGIDYQLQSGMEIWIGNSENVIKLG